MEKLTEVFELRDDHPFPLLIILLNEVPLSLTVIVLHQTTVPNVLQHMKVGLTLNLLVVPHTIEETVCAVLNLHEGPESHPHSFGCGRPYQQPGTQYPQSAQISWE